MDYLLRKISTCTRKGNLRIGDGVSLPKHPQNKREELLLLRPPSTESQPQREEALKIFKGTHYRLLGRVPSFLDQHEGMDGDSSYSPLPVASTIFNNSMAGRSDFNYSEPPSSTGHYVSQDKIRLGLMSVGIEPLAHNVDVNPQASIT
ncbi:hypothetical protein NC651_032825 [Populus alba x Populus x berolinensis]|nr:hypothetical protein NC651_032825 [Populus alba x Populus x berolinensis]